MAKMVIRRLYIYTPCKNMNGNEWDCNIATCIQSLTQKLLPEFTTTVRLGIGSPGCLVAGGNGDDRGDKHHTAERIEVVVQQLALLFQNADLLARWFGLDFRG